MVEHSRVGKGAMKRHTSLGAHGGMQFRRYQGYFVTARLQTRGQPREREQVAGRTGRDYNKLGIQGYSMGLKLRRVF